MADGNKINELPRIQGDQTDRLQVEGFQSFSITVTDTANKEDLPPNVTAVSIEYPSDTVLTDPVFMGGPDVSAVLGHANRGKTLSHGKTVDLDACVLPYIIAPTGKSVILTVFYGK